MKRKTKRGKKELSKYRILFKNIPHPLRDSRSAKAEEHKNNSSAQGRKEQSRRKGIKMGSDEGNQGVAGLV